MAWTQVTTVSEGDVVQTPHGQGVVERVYSDGKSARVMVSGQRYEVPMENMNPGGKLGEPSGQSGSQSGDFQPGDTVTAKGKDGEWRVTKVQERGVWAQPVKGGTAQRFRRDALTKTQPAGEPYPEPSQEPSAQSEPSQEPQGFKKGDKVEVLSNDGGSVNRPGDKGEVVEVTGGSIKVSVPGRGQGGNWHRPDELKKADEPKVGDRVKVTDDGKVYSSYERWGGLAMATSWKPGNNARNDDEGTVSHIQEHGDGRDTLALVTKDSGEQFIIGTEGLEVTEAKETIKEETGDTVAQTGDGLTELLQLKQYMEKKIDSELDEELRTLKDAVKQNQKLEIKIGDKTTVLKGRKHRQLDTLITYSGLRLATLMVGMAGTGKTHAAEQVAEALDLSFFSMSVGAQTSKSDIIGYMDAHGNYVKTFFREAYENGGVFLMDEIDAGNANVLIQVNAALSNGLCAFPDKMVKKHSDFVFIASANTYGNGANRQYVGRNQLDAATLDRFAVLDWKIDDELESQLAVGNYGAAWYKAVRAARDFVAEKKIRALISPRATQKGSQLLAAGVNVDEVINATLLGSVPEDKKADVIQVATRVYDKASSTVPSKVKELIREEPIAEPSYPF